MNTKTMIAVVTIVCLVAGAAGGYFVRPLIRGNTPASQFGNRQGGSRNGQGRPGMNGQFGGRVFGTVQSTGDGRITVQSPNGGSQIVLTNDSTAYQHVVVGSASDVTTGAQVIVMGQQNPDGSTTAMSIQVIPPGMNFPFGGNRQGEGNQPNPTQQ
jgi:hypothetical protein